MNNKNDEIGLFDFTTNNTFENRLKFGLYYEKVLLAFLDKYDLNFKNVSIDKPKSFYDFLRFDIRNKPIILELKSIVNNSNENVFLVSHYKVQKYKKMLIKHPNLRFIYIFNQVVSQYEYQFWYHDIDINKINNDEYFLTQLPSGSKYLEIPKRSFGKLEDCVDLLN